MIESDARVVAIEGGRTWVEADRRSSCGQCSASGSCGGSLFAELFGSRPVRVEVTNPIQAQVGQQVIVGLPEQAMLRGSLGLYLLPLVGLMAGALIGQWLADSLFSQRLGEFPAIILGLFGLWLGPWLWRRLKPSAGDTINTPVILRNRPSGLSVAFAGLNEDEEKI
ncbi:MAG: SoxR reducing system RseC family protein [Gammaproteobacteria bacterium]|nr:SoxR reducing system RseC family protein [Gammaproteobacteria bacterium]